MKLGVATNYCWFGPPITAIAQTIESLGFESMWMGEHPVIPVLAANAVRYGVPLPENYRHMPDPFTSLAAAAAVTSRLNSARMSAFCRSTIRSTSPKPLRR